MNKLVKILIVIDTTLCFVLLILKGCNILNISGNDIALVGGVVMSPELFVAINKCCEKFRKNE